MRNKYMIYSLITLLIVIFLTGFLTFTGHTEQLIKEANSLYKQKEYEKAQELYELGLSRDSGEKKLNYNFANLKFQLEKYQDAIEFYKKGSDSSNKYLLSGNASYMLAEDEQNPEQKMKLYQQALELYKTGIIKYPQDINLKYNYEYLEKKLEDMEDKKQNKEQQSNDQDNKDKQEKQEDESQNQDSKNENSDQGQKNKNDQQNKQENQDSQKNKQEEQEKNQQGKESNKSQENQEENYQSKKQPSEEKSDQDQEQIMQVLKMLEKQEEDSLKNNQTLYLNTKKEEENDW